MVPFNLRLGLRDNFRVPHSHCTLTSSTQRSLKYEGVSKTFRTESIMKYTLTTINTRTEATQRVMAANLTRLTHKIVMQLHLLAESCVICSPSSRRPVRKLLDTSSYNAELNEEYVSKRILYYALTYVRN
jgi:hypothetical protein